MDPEPRSFRPIRPMDPNGGESVGQSIEGSVNMLAMKGMKIASVVTLPLPFRSLVPPKRRGAIRQNGAAGQPC